MVESFKVHTTIPASISAIMKILLAILIVTILLSIILVEIHANCPITGKKFCYCKVCRNIPRIKPLDC
ncbi:hypothetical protein CBL_12399 [Carabus blaptoides fortunei]